MQILFLCINFVKNQVTFLYVVEFTDYLCDNNHSIVLVRSHKNSFCDHSMLLKIADSRVVLLKIDNSTCYVFY